jgi:NAD(P)-dependent dehydrogenase (short-subunit alcohol dehydrogenase family)
MQNLFSLEGRVAVVTGGSRGIGAMIAKGFLVYGAKRVYITARKAAACDAAAEALSQYGECVSLPGDVSTMEGIEGLTKRLLEKPRTSSTSWSTTPARPGARRSTSSPKAAGTRSST